MKTLLKIFSAIALLATISLPAQQISGPLTGSPITVSSNFFVPGITTTNIPTTLANLIPIGRNGVGLFFRVGATNAASTTNATIVLEQSVNGTDWVDSHTFSVSVPQNGTTGNDVYTNIPPTTVNLSNARYLRVKSIQNTNVLGIFFTNLTWSVKE